MRDYGRISPRFWTAGTGKSLRGDRDAQVVALYLMSAPGASMTGLYYLPLVTLAHETGLPSEGASKALARLSEGGFCRYDHHEEVVWVVNMAREQIGERLALADNRVKSVAREVAQYRRCVFFSDFLERYGAAYHIKDDREEHGKAKPLRSPSEAPPKPLRSQEQEQEQDQDHLPPTPQGGEKERAAVVAAAKALVAIPQRAGIMPDAHLLTLIADLSEGLAPGFSPPLRAVECVPRIVEAYDAVRLSFEKRPDWRGDALDKHKSKVQRIVVGVDPMPPPWQSDEPAPTGPLIPMK